jgi:hypothetical protein
MKHSDIVEFGIPLLYLAVNVILDAYNVKYNLFFCIGVNA